MGTKAYQASWPLCVLYLMVVSVAASQAGIIYVDDDAPGGNNGSSWTEAFSDLRDAISIAQAGDEIRVAQGIYTPTQDPLDREATFELKDGVTISGGYGGLTEMYPDFRHIKFFATILSGDLDHSDGIDPNSKQGNSRHVVTCIGQGNSAVLDGVVVTGGYALGDIRPHNYSDSRGAAFYCQSGSPVLIDCSFNNNEAGSGAVYISGGSQAVFTRCVWEGNYAGAGAAIYANRSAYVIRLNQCVFRRNVAIRNGGAIHTDIMGDLQMINCLFVANTAGESGGAISCNASNDGTGRSSIRLVNCTFYGNTSPTFINPPTNTEKQPDGSRVYWSDSVVTNCIFYNEPSEMAVSIHFGRIEPLILTSIYEREVEPGQPRPVPPSPEVLFADPYGADGNLGTEDDDFRSVPGSPLIDSGTNQAEPSLPPMDLDGNPRILNEVVDVGAYEFAGGI